MMSSVIRPESTGLVPGLGPVLSRLRLEVVEAVGSGSFGCVFEVKSADGKRWALKTSKEIRKEAEFTLWSRMDHPNVVRMEAFFIVRPQDPTYGVVMPFCSTDLSEITCTPKFRQRWYSFCRALRWLKDILSGLEYMHSNGVAHLDLKLNNILLGESGQAVICDFTFATVTERPTRDWGLPEHYRPLEGSRGRFPDPLVDPKPFDMWSVGALALKMLTGQNLAYQGALSFEDKYENLCHLLSEDGFQSYVSSYLYGSRFESGQLAQARNFVHGLLRLDPDERASARTALDHVLLGGSTEFPLGTEWSEPMPVRDLESWIAQYHDSLRQRAAPENPRLRKFSPTTPFAVFDEHGEVVTQCRPFADEPDDGEPEPVVTTDVSESNDGGTAEADVATNASRVPDVRELDNAGVGSSSDAADAPGTSRAANRTCDDSRRRDLRKRRRPEDWDAEEDESPPTKKRKTNDPAVSAVNPDHPLESSESSNTGRGHDDPRARGRKRRRPDTFDAEENEAPPAKKRKLGES